jgi:hypothetical protein
MNMEITKLGVRISLDPKDFKGPSLLEWACKRPLKNENFLSLIQSDIEDCEREIIGDVLNTEGKTVRVTYTRMDSDGNSMPMSLQDNSSFWKDLKFANASGDVVEYLKENEYKVEV